MQALLSHAAAAAVSHFCPVLCKKTSVVRGARALCACVVRGARALCVVRVHYAGLQCVSARCCAMFVRWSCCAFVCRAHQTRCVQCCVLRVGSAAAVRGGVLLCAAVGVCVMFVRCVCCVCVRLRKEQKPAQLVE